MNIPTEVFATNPGLELFLARQLLYVGMTFRTQTTVLLILLLESCQQPVPVAPINGDSNLASTATLGLVASLPGENASLPHLELARLSGYQAPTAVDLKRFVGTAWHQGQLGSCGGFATAIFSTVLNAENNGWTTIDLDHRFSPAFVYNQINGGRDKGSSLYQAMRLLVEKGIAFERLMPYNDTDWTTQPSWQAVVDGLKHRIASIEWLDPTQTESIKSYLAAGYPVVSGVPVYPDFDRLSPTNKVYDEVSGKSRGNHAVAIVGYDDRLHAFLFKNSWDDGLSKWGLDGGYGYIDYALFADQAFDVYTTRDRITPSPSSTLDLQFGSATQVADWATSTLKSNHRFEVVDGAFSQTDTSTRDYVDSFSSAKSVSVGAMSAAITFTVQMHVGPGRGLNSGEQPNILSLLQFPRFGWGFNVQVSDHAPTGQALYQAFNSFGPNNAGWRLYQDYTRLAHATNVTGLGWSYTEMADQDYWVRFVFNKATGTISAATSKSSTGPWSSVGTPYAESETGNLVSRVFSNSTLDFQIGFGTYASTGGIKSLKVEVK